MNKPFYIILILIIGLISACGNEYQKQLNPEFDINEILEFAQSQYRRATLTLTDTTRMPISANADGSWQQANTGNWISGFFSGILWQLYDATQDQFWQHQAARWNTALENEKNNRNTHDLGFMLYCSFGTGYLLTGNEEYIPILLQGAESLISRFNPVTGTIKSWNSDPENHLTIIDNMMNLEFLFWASQKSGDSKYRDIALTHTENTIKNQFRKDYSTYHVLNYDPITGVVKEKKTSQGFSDESLWARGQAWGAYGFTMVYRETREKRYLEIAKKTFDRFISGLPEDMIPYWDFDAPNIPNEPRESSAAAIAASGLLELSSFMTSQKEKNKYFNNAVKLLNALSTENYLAKTDSYQCVLLHSNESVPRKKNVDVNFTYADYYYIEALIRLKKILDSRTLSDKSKKFPPE